MENIEQQVCDLVSEYLLYIFPYSDKITISLDDDLARDLDMDIFDLDDFVENFFEKFKVNPMNFNVEFYDPWCAMSMLDTLIISILIIVTFFLPEKIRWWLFPSTRPLIAPDFTIRMLVESAKAGYWLYDPVDTNKSNSER